MLPVVIAAAMRTAPRSTVSIGSFTGAPVEKLGSVLSRASPSSVLSSASRHASTKASTLANNPLLDPSARHSFICAAISPNGTDFQCREIRDLVAIIYDQSDRLVVVFIHLKMHPLMGGTGKRATGRSQRKILGVHRHHLLGGKPAIDPVRPMLLQLGAGANQREWSGVARYQNHPHATPCYGSCRGGG